MRYHYLFRCMVREHGGVGHSELTCLQIMVDWHDTNRIEQLRDSSNIVNWWEMPDYMSTSWSSLVVCLQ